MVSVLVGLVVAEVAAAALEAEAFTVLEDLTGSLLVVVPLEAVMEVALVVGTVLAVVSAEGMGSVVGQVLALG